MANEEAEAVEKTGKKPRKKMSKTRARVWLWGSVILVIIVSVVMVYTIEQEQKNAKAKLRMKMDSARKADMARFNMMPDDGSISDPMDQPIEPVSINGKPNSAAATTTNKPPAKAVASNKTTQPAATVTNPANNSANSSGWGSASKRVPMMPPRQQSSWNIKAKQTKKPAKQPQAVQVAATKRMAPVTQQPVKLSHKSNTKTVGRVAGIVESKLLQEKYGSVYTAPVQPKWNIAIVDKSELSTHMKTPAKKFVTLYGFNILLEQGEIESAFSHDVIHLLRVDKYIYSPGKEQNCYAEPVFLSDNGALSHANDAEDELLTYTGSTVDFDYMETPDPPSYYRMTDGSIMKSKSERIRVASKFYTSFKYIVKGEAKPKEVAFFIDPSRDGYMKITMDEYNLVKRYRDSRPLKKVTISKLSIDMFRLFAEHFDNSELFGKSKCQKVH